MAFLAGAASLRAPFMFGSSSRRRTLLPVAVKATPNSSSDSHHPLISSLRLVASAAALLAATSPAIACTPSPPPPPAALTVVSPEDPVPDESYPFEKLIVETAAIARFGRAEAARARLSAAGGGDQYARLLTAQALFVDGKVDKAMAAFEELAREGPGDYRPFFCQGVLYSIMGREAEADSMLARCREVAGAEFDPDYTLLISAIAAAVPEFVAEKVEAEAGKL